MSGEKSQAQAFLSSIGSSSTGSTDAARRTVAASPARATAAPVAASPARTATATAQAARPAVATAAAARPVAAVGAARPVSAVATSAKAAPCTARPTATAAQPAAARAPAVAAPAQTTYTRATPAAATSAAQPSAGRAATATSAASPGRTAVAASPAKAVASPAKAVASPAKAVASPAKAVASTAKAAVTPARAVASAQPAQARCSAQDFLSSLDEPAKQAPAAVATAQPAQAAARPTRGRTPTDGAATSEPSSGRSRRYEVSAPAEAATPSAVQGRRRGTRGGVPRAPPPPPPPMTPAEAALAWEQSYRVCCGKPAPAEAARRATSTAYCLTLHAVQGAALPKAIIRAAELAGASPLSDSESAPTVLFKLHVSFFDTEQRRFFSRTWESDEIALTRSQLLEEAGISQDFDVDLFFHSKLQGSRCALVIEQSFALSFAGRTLPVENREVGAGWCVIRPFQPTAAAGRQTSTAALPDLADYQSGKLEEQVQKVQLFKGSALALLHISPPLETSRALSLGKAQLLYSISTHKELAKAVHLMPEDTIFSSQQPMPGLLPYADPQTGAVAVSSFEYPSLQTPLRLTASAFSLSVPPSFEAELIKKLLETHYGPPFPQPLPSNTPSIIRQRAQSYQTAATQLRINNWRLMVGIHSTYAPCAPPPSPGAVTPAGPKPASGVVVELSATPQAAAATPEDKGQKGKSPQKGDKASSKGGKGFKPDDALLLKSGTGRTAALDGYFLSPQVALVVELQVEVTFPPSERNRSSSVRWLPAAWGCIVPLYDLEKPLQQGRVPIELCFAAAETSAPLSSEALAGEAAVMSAGTVVGELELKASAMWKELLQKENLSSDAKHASAIAAAQTTERLGMVSMDPRTAEAEFGKTCVGPAAEQEIEKEDAALRLVFEKKLSKEEAERTMEKAKTALKFWQGHLREAVFRAWRLVARIQRQETSLGFLSITVHSLKLLDRFPNQNISQLWILVYPLVTQRPLHTPRVASGKTQALLNFQEQIEILPGTPGAHALATALNSTEEYDNSFAFVLRCCDADGLTVVDLAEGLYSLVAMWQTREDVVRQAITLNSPEGHPTAEITISISAVEMLKALTSPPPPKKPLRQKEEAPGTAEPARPAVSKPPETEKLQPPRSKAEVAMEQARLEREDLASSVAQQLAAVPAPHTSSALDRSDRAMLWQASQRLEKTLEQQIAPAVEEDNWTADTTHNILFQFVSFAPSSGHATSGSLYISFQMYHFEPRTTPRALLQRPSDAAAAAAAGASNAVTDGNIAIKVGELNLARALREGPSSPLFVSISLPANLSSWDSELSLRTEPQSRRTGGKIHFNYQHTVPVATSGRALTKLMELLHSTDAAATSIRFTLHSAPRARGNSAPSELGSGSLSLLELVRNGQDAEEVQVSLSSSVGAVGSLGVSCRAIDALRAAQDAAGARAAARVQAPSGSIAALLEKRDAAPSVGAGDDADKNDLMLVAADPALAREGPGLVERFLMQPPTEGREGHADWDRHAELQAKRFKEYLRSKCVYIDVWDGTSLLQVGTARVPLAALLRKGTEQVGNAGVVKEYLSVDVLATQLNSIDSAPSADAASVVHPMSRGKLKLVLARLSVAPSKAGGAIGSGSGRAAAARAGSRSAKVSPLDVTADGQALGADGMLQDAGQEKRKVRLRALTSGSAANIVKVREPTAADASALYRRQLRRQKQREWLRAATANLSSSSPPALSGDGTPHDAAANTASSTALAVVDLSKSSGALGSVARALEMGMDEEHILARARLQMQMRELRAAEAYRQAHKEERLRSLLQSSTQQVQYLYPHYGSVAFVEIPFRNPYGAEHCFNLSWEDPFSHLSIVKSVQEWRSLKTQNGLTTPAEEKLVMQGQQLWLMPHEMVYIPIKYQAWQHGQVVLDATSKQEAQSTEKLLRSGPRAVASAPIAARTIFFTILNVKAEEVAFVELRVRPQPYVIDQTFRFHQSENEERQRALDRACAVVAAVQFLKTTIRLQGVRWHSTGLLATPLHADASDHVPPAPLPFSAAPTALGTSYAPQPVWVRTSDPDVVAGVHEQRTPNDPVEVSIKYKCAASPAVTRFLVLVYSDVWMHRLLETWEIIVHSLQRIDVHALVGQTSVAKALLRGEAHSAHGLVQCFSSVPQELSLSPSAPFALAHGTLNEVSLQLRPLAAGRKQYVVHAVDLSRRALLSSWLVCAVNRFPAITKVFSLPVHSAFGANKKVSLSNPYTYDATFRFFTDQPHLLQFKESELVVPAGDTRYIGLKFLPLDGPSRAAATAAGSTKLLVFVNNEEDKNEECMEITVLYSDRT